MNFVVDIEYNCSSLRIYRRKTKIEKVKTLKDVQEKKDLLLERKTEQEKKTL